MAAFDELIAAGLSSRSSQIVNETVAAWNKTYGRRNNVIYSARTAKALRKLTALDVDLALASSLPPQDDEVSHLPDLDSIARNIARSRELHTAFKAMVEPNAAWIDFLLLFPKQPMLFNPRTCS
jgi:hypothetical protein